MRNLLFIIFALFSLPSLLFGNVYPTLLEAPQFFNKAIMDSIIIGFYLNEPADNGAIIRIFNAGGDTVRVFELSSALRGENSISWDGMDEFGADLPDGSYTFEVTAQDDGHTFWEKINLDSGENAIWYPKGVCVNKNRSSPYFGLVYVANGETGTSSNPGAVETPEGLYIYYPDCRWLEEGFASGNLVCDFGPTPNSPFKPFVAENDRLYLCDWSDGYMNLYVGDALFSALSIEMLFMHTDSAINHGSISAVAVVDTGDTRKIYSCDEDLSGVSGNIWRYDIPESHSGVWSNFPDALILNKETDYSTSPSYPFDFAMDDDGNIFVVDKRSTILSDDNVFMFSPTGEELWSARTGYITIPPEAVSIDASDEWVAVGISGGDGKIYIFNGSGDYITSFSTGGGNLRDIAFDRAGNLYTVNSSTERLSVFSPPDGENSFTTRFYSCIQLAHSTGSPPELLDIPDIILNEGEARVIELADYIVDPRAIIWDAHGNRNIEIDFDGSTATILAPHGWTGTESIYFVATNAYLLSDSNLVNIAVNDIDVVEFKKGPYLMYGTETTQVIMWETELPGNSIVMYGLTQEYTDTISISEGVTIHEVTLRELLPETIYHYRIKTGESYSHDFHFKTAINPATAFMFVVAGDNRTDHDMWHATCVAMLSENPDITFNTGDVVTLGTVYSQWGTEFFNPARELLYYVPMYISIGNHEADAHWYYDFVSYPAPENCYTFKYGNSFFIIFDANKDYYTDPDTNTYYNWFLDAISSPEAQEATFRFVFFHQPPYSEGWDSPGYDGDHELRTTIVPLMEEYNATICFNGHTHDYERGYLNGVHYIITGGGGASLDHWIQDFEHITVYASEYHYCLVYVNGDNLCFEAKKLDGELIDSFCITGSTAIKKEDIKPAFSVSWNYPNPFNSRTELLITLTEETSVSIELFNTAGERVATVADRKPLTAGRHSIIWEPSKAGKLPSGIYLVQITAGKNRIVRKVVYLK
ncbi:MAG: hypothetical protein B6D65_03675 [candidate division Zixibacteria bacterium 4484_93]|nr:MAG: hypothetical protein B6D65_03675 [candidate division Zixibacteria bacterium 4484_93]